jgi:hypothetical protein
MNERSNFRPAMPGVTAAAGMTHRPGPMAAMGGFHHPSHPHYHGFCHGCGHPAHLCCCHKPHCRNEAKELLVEPAGKSSILNKLEAADELTKTVAAMAAGMLETKTAPSAAASGSLGLLRSMSVSKEELGDLKNDALNIKDTVDLTAIGAARAFIGGGCCVHLSIEYMPYNVLTSDTALVVVGVMDSDATFMTWGKVIEAKSGYQIKEDIITTFAGAKLVVIGYNMIARVRWCEVFSC